MKKPVYTPPTKKDGRIGLLIIAAYVLAISLTAFWLLPDLLYVWLLIVVGGLVWLINWHTHNYAYHCRRCDHEFEVSFWINLISPHGFDREGGWTWLKCPACQQHSRARVVKVLPSEQWKDE